MNHRSRRPLTTLLRDGLGGALDWRLLTLFTTVVLATTAVAAFPLWRVLAKLLDASPRAKEIAQAFDPLALEEMIMAVVRSAAPITGASMIATLLAAFSWPLLAGMAVGAARADRPCTFAQLLMGGIAYYTRMLRIGLVSIVPLALVGGVASLAFWGVRRQARDALLESQATLAWRVAIIAVLVVFAAVHASLELGRAGYAADDDLRSGWQAWLRGAGLTVRQPLRVLGIYLGATLASYAIALPLLVARLRISGPTAVQLVTGFVLAQLAVAALGWGRAARLFAFAALSRSHSAAGLTPADAPEASPRVARDVPAGPIVSRPGSA